MPPIHFTVDVVYNVSTNVLKITLSDALIIQSDLIMQDFNCALLSHEGTIEVLWPIKSSYDVTALSLPAEGGRNSDSENSLQLVLTRMRCDVVWSGTQEIGEASLLAIIRHDSEIFEFREVILLLFLVHLGVGSSRRKGREANHVAFPVSSLSGLRCCTKEVKGKATVV